MLQILSNYPLLDIVSDGIWKVEYLADSLIGFMSIAEQMGRTLQKTAVSINIKER
jgi:hypothetical protein